MKAKVTGMLLALLTGTAWAQVGGLTNAEVIEQTSITDPGKAVQTAQGQWIAFSMPVVEGTRSPCCWHGQWSNFREVGCSLEKQHESYGTSSDSPLTENVIAFARVTEGEVRSLRVVGEQCPVEGGGARVTWIGSVDSAASLNWLEAVARSSDHDSMDYSALYLMSLHASKEASERLYALAGEPDGELAEEAVFAISQLPGETGTRMLLELAKDEQKPREVRRQALFWLANSDDENAVAALADLLTR
jgi:hypothetical protein